MISQEELKELFLPIMKEEGATYHKYRMIRARQAVEGEHVTSVTSDGKETENIAESGDYLVENQTSARERYLVSSQKFGQRYEKQGDEENGWSIYKPTGKVYAIELSDELLSKLDLQDEFQIEAPWGAAEVVRKHDFMVSPLDFTEVYRIARNEFYETYKEGEKY